MTWCRIKAETIRKKMLGSSEKSILPEPAILFPNGNGD
jgi:hypothetical protein